MLPSKPRILALDLASTTGWATWCPGSAPRAGSFRLPKTENVGEFVAAFEHWWKDVIVFERPDFVLFEAPFIAGKTSQAVARKLLGLSGFLEYLCFVERIPCNQCRINDWRLHFTGKGSGKRDELKRLTMQACADRGLKPENQDEADAYGLLDYAAHILRLEPDWSPGPLFREDRGAVAV